MIYKFKAKTFSACLEDATDYRCTSPRTSEPVLRSIFRSLELDDYQEHFVMIALNAKGMVMGFKALASGTDTGVLITPAMVFRAALVLGGTSVLVCHNHPSGDPTPSREDKLLTQRCRQAGVALGLPLADHIVLGKDTFHSFRASEGWDNEIK